MWRNWKRDLYRTTITSSKPTASGACGGTHLPAYPTSTSSHSAYMLHTMGCQKENLPCSCCRKGKEFSSSSLHYV